MAFGNYKINILKQDLICQQVCTDVAAFVWNGRKVPQKAGGF